MDLTEKADKVVPLGLRIDNLERKLRDLKDVRHDKRVMDLEDAILRERGPLIQPVREELSKLIAEREAKRRPPAPRWSVDCPQSVIDACTRYWRGTTNSGNFRIHAWNDKHILTSYPGGSAYNRFNGAETFRAGYYVISTAATNRMDGDCVDLPGRACPRIYEEVLANYKPKKLK